MSSRPSLYELRGEGLVWLIGAVVCLCAAPLVQLFISADNGWPHNSRRIIKIPRCIFGVKTGKWWSSGDLFFKIFACTYDRCSSRTSCVDSHLDKRWLSSAAWECIRIPPQFVNPVSIAITASIQVTWRVIRYRGGSVRRSFLFRISCSTCLPKILEIGWDTSKLQSKTKWSFWDTVWNPFRAWKPPSRLKKSRIRKKIIQLRDSIFLIYNRLRIYALTRVGNYVTLRYVASHI